MKKEKVESCIECTLLAIDSLRGTGKLRRDLHIMLGHLLDEQKMLEKRGDAIKKAVHEVAA